MELDEASAATSGLVDDSPPLPLAHRMKTARPLDRVERVLLLGVEVRGTARHPHAGRGAAARESLRELEELAASAGAQVTGSLLQIRDALDPATLVGRGKLDEVRVEAEIRDAPLILVDRNLSPVQLRNIERITGRRVMDRTQLILDIFARRARTREGQLQVELAQLSYLLPRLTGRGTELSRLGGGIGTRGPGEQKLETDRRRIRDRIRKIQSAIETVRRQRATRRQARHAVPLGTVALVGYTNAGKSTLFNALTRAAVPVSPKMFATLDPTLRALILPSRRRVLLSDTVGFIRDLPPDLIAAFRATLEEVQDAAVILHVTDFSNAAHAEHDVEVMKILEELGVAQRPRLHVFNKIDLLAPEEGAALQQHANGSAVFVSAATGAGFAELLARIDELMPVDPLVRMHLMLPLADGRSHAAIYACGRVLHTEQKDGFLAIEADLPQSLAWRLSEYAERAGEGASTFCE
jgi:GTPase